MVGEHKLGTDIDCGNTGCTKAVQRIKVLKVILHENLSKLKITNAKISEQNELKNKIDKQIFRKIEIENLMTSI